MNTKLKGIARIFIFLLFSYVAHANDAIKWTFETNGKVIAAPIIQGDTIFIGSLDGYFYAINAATGNEIWKYNTNNEIRTTAVIFNKELICFESGNTMFGLDLGGNLLWSKVIYSGAVTNEHDKWDCFRSSPTLNDSIAYIGSEEGKVVGVHLISGEIVYSVQTPQANTSIETTPAIFDDKIFVGDWLGVFTVFSLDSSKVIWQYDTKNDNTYGWVNAIVSKPLIYNDTVYFGGRNCNLQVVIWRACCF
jgi:outer membrane protein assembly factor BamB